MKEAGNIIRGGVECVNHHDLPLPGFGLSADNHMLDEKISNIFFSIGIPAHIKGYHYLREAVKLTAGNFEMVSGITKNLYPQVARRFNTSICGVARSMRNAIDIAWNKGKIVNLNAIFGCDVYGSNDKPSNSELIALLAEKIYIDSV